MAKERLSKLQKWILEKCLENLEIHRTDVFEFFGKKFSERYRSRRSWLIDIPNIFERLNYNRNDWIEKQITGRFWDFEKKEYTEQTKKFYKAKEELIITKSEQVIITRSLKNLRDKRFLNKVKPVEWGDHYLTKKGFLKANKMSDASHFANFKEYEKQLLAKLKGVGKIAKS